MSIPSILESIALILMLALPSIQVDILMSRALVYPAPIQMICRDIAPGVCCVSPWQDIFGSRMEPEGLVSYDGAGVVKFENLHAFDIAAVWGRRSTTTGFWPFTQDAEIRACSGRILESRPGPGDWLLNMSIANNERQTFTIAHGASYISLPTIVPPKGQVGNWLTAEGILGLSWGGGNWFASLKASQFLQNHLRKRDVRSPNKGQVYAMPPPRFQYPAIMSINGTEYTAQVVGGVLYKNDDTGEVVNVTSFGI